MILEILLVLQIAGLAFLALSLIPFKSNGDSTSLPFLNRIIFVFISFIIFISLALTATQYQYTYCYIQNVTANYAMNMTISDATCTHYLIENVEVAYLNWGLSVIAIVLFLIMTLLALSFRKEALNRD